MTITTGEYLVSKSSLPSGTAMAHWLAMQSGTGSDRVIYCSQFTTVLTHDEITVTRKPKRSALTQQPAVAPSVAEKSTKQQTNYFAFMSPQVDVVSFFEPDEITATQRANSLAVTQDLAQETITRKPKRVAIN